ncbi:uncharacterized protein J4E78_005493 [Alternaria triticimaculans]|uniref:uncharacterized protein n=1 Tax=Alternaria triticimaculans TaxID=297637 RepID=UPI0020C44BA8|nr:uncharacterized protein J4E78_005493 [Alternaria triticimaculans]KAI4659069.1 hypothetical protein J4E78_005493 [Alternaria triticimaculans]
MARPTKASVPKTSSLSAEHGRRKTRNSAQTSLVLAELENDVSMEPEQESEDANMAPPPQLPRKRGVTARTRSSASQEEEEDMLDNIILALPISKPKQKSKPNLPLKTPGESDHVVLKDEADCSNFLTKADGSEEYLRDMKILEVHLDTTKLFGYTEDRFAMAFNKLHPRGDNATNPQDLQTLRLVIKGNILLTRYSYHLISPFSSAFVNDKLKKFADGKLSDEEREKLPYKLNSTEKLLANALMGIRGVKQVHIESRGKGTVEADFAATIKATLVQPPGTDILEVSDEESEYSTHVLNRLGPIYSPAYSGDALNPYASLAPPEIELVDDSEESDDDVLAAAIAEPHKSVRRRPKEDDPVIMSGPRTRGTMAKKAGEVEENDGNSDEEDEHGYPGLGLIEMVRIYKQKSRPGDIDSEPRYDVLPIVLTAREEAVEMGWKV